MVAVWLLATQHCVLETAGLLTQGCCDEASGQHHGNTEHDTDGCSVVEGTSYKSNHGTVKVSEPVLLACLRLVCAEKVADALAEAPATPTWTYAQRPRDWVPTWCFVQRTALPSRAPSFA